MLWLAIAVLALLAAGLMGFLWRRAAGELPPMAVVLVLITILVASGLYLTQGIHKETPRWIADWQDYNEFARQVIAGEPDPEMAAEVPLASLARVLQRQLHLTPSAEGWYVLALVYSEMEAPRVAVTAARRAVESSDGALEPQLLLARTLIEQEKGKLTSESAELLENIIAEYPQHDGALTLLASSAMQSQDYSRALPAWQRLLARHGDGEAAPLIQGMIDEATQKRAAQEYYRDLTVTVSADPWLAPGGTLFVFLRHPGGSGQPLAAVRVLADRFPMTVVINGPQWLQQMPEPGTELVAGARYDRGVAGGVEAADIVASPVTLSGTSGELQAALHLGTVKPEAMSPASSYE